MSKVLRDVLLRFTILIITSILLPSLSHAIVKSGVTGPCINCHTMHNSQAGTEQVVTVAGNAGWTAAGAWTGATNPTPQPQLLRSNCIGCHSSPGASTIVLMNGAAANRVPIVYNFVDPGEANELAGGNFFHVVGNPGNGHNIAGISPLIDPVSPAPGTLPGIGCANSCHESLFAPNTSTTLTGQTGCEGCHLNVGHHSAPSDQIAPVTPGVIDGPGDAYRFLSGHMPGVGNVQNLTAAVGDRLYTEGSDWGQLATEANVYLGTDDASVNQKDPLPIGRFCAGCHHAFHAAGEESDVFDQPGENLNAGDRNLTPNDGGAWLRHPVNVGLGNSGEFSTFPFFTAYSPQLQIPLARSNTDLRTNPLVPGDQVMCLSCHKAHGSRYPDSLRFDYTGVIAHSGDGQTNGCFYCHKEKDDP